MRVTVSTGYVAVPLTGASITLTGEEAMMLRCLLGKIGGYGDKPADKLYLNTSDLHKEYSATDFRTKLINPLHAKLSGRTE